MYPLLPVPAGFPSPASTLVAPCFCRTAGRKPIARESNPYQFIASLNSSIISFAAQIPACWYSGSERIYLGDLEFWSLYVSSIFCNFISATLLISQFGEMMFFGVSFCKYWEWKKTSLHSLLQWSSNSALYWHIPAYCLPVYLLIRILVFLLFSLIVMSS